MPKKKRILVIEDSEIIASLLEDSLEMMGHEVTTASSGIEGLRRAEQMLPDIITLDIMMSGLDGVQVLKKLKNNQKTKDIPVVIISVAASNYKKEGLQLGALAFLKKPVDFEQLNSTIKSITHKKTVLVVEDSPVILEIVKEKMTSMGYEVDCAENGETAVKKALEMKPDIILMDVYLPQQNGFQITKKLKENVETADIPVIAFSGHFSDDIDTERIVGIDKFLEKEFSAEDLVAEVADILNRTED